MKIFGLAQSGQLGEEIRVSGEEQIYKMKHQLK